MSSVTATLTYFVPPVDGSPAWTSTSPNLITGKRESNFSRTRQTVQIANLRGKEDTVSLDKAGFQLFKCAPKHTSFQYDKEILDKYYPESEALLKELTGASRVVLFDHTISRRHPGTLESPQNRQPVTLVHVDQTRAAAISRIHRHLSPTEAPELLRKHFQIINLWRPIGHAALDWPLALCDYTSVDRERDLVPVTLKFPDRNGETFGVQWNEKHRWGYFRGMEPDELVMIKCFDSIEDGSVAVFTPHTGFQDPSTPDGAPLRESIELRALVFYD